MEDWVTNFDEQIDIKTPLRQDFEIQPSPFGGKTSKSFRAWLNSKLCNNKEIAHGMTEFDYYKMIVGNFGIFDFKVW